MTPHWDQEPTRGKSLSDKVKSTPVISDAYLPSNIIINDLSVASFMIEKVLPDGGLLREVSYKILRFSNLSYIIGCNPFRSLKIELKYQFMLSWTYACSIYNQM